MKHLIKAFSQIGFKETKGQPDNPEVLKYFNALGFDGEKLKDETAWCAAFANWVLKESGLQYQNTLNARSFLKIGAPVDVPKIGDVVVLWRKRKNSVWGHVGFFIRETPDFIYILGGNQSDRVKVSAYPKGRLLEYRRITN